MCNDVLTDVQSVFYRLSPTGELPGGFAHSVNKNMLTQKEWDRLLNPSKTADHIHKYASEVYHRTDPENHILYTLKCLCKLSKQDQKQWYIIQDVVYHIPTYKKTYHRYSPGEQEMISGTMQRVAFNPRNKKERTQ